MSGDQRDDADRDALRRVAAMGADLSRPMEVDFFVAVPNRDAGETVARLAARVGYHAEATHDEEDDAWDCHCRKTMILTHEAVVAAQRELDALARPLDGRIDGWGASAG